MTSPLGLWKGRAMSLRPRILSLLHGEIGRKVAWNLGGQILPMAAALLVVPPLIVGLGTARFALLTIVWTLLGYFSFFDLGISRSLTYRVAQLAGSNDPVPEGSSIRSGLAFLIAFGSAIGAIIWLTAPAIAAWLLAFQGTSIDHAECVGALRLVAIGIPVVMISSGMRGILEGRSQFAVLNSILIPGGILTFVAPFLALGYDRTIFGVTAAVLAARCATAAALAIAVLLTDRRISLLGKISRDEFRRLIGFGAWVSVSSVVSPIMVYGDRFILVSLVSLSDIAFYTTPFDILVRLLFIPSAIVGVFFPLLVQGRENGVRALAEQYARTIKIVGSIVILMGLALLIFAGLGLELWLGAEFRLKSELIVQILALGLIFNGLAIAPYSLLQAAGRPDFNAKLHLAELPVYLILLTVFVSHWGILGAACVWTLRVAVDAVILFIAARRLAFRIPADRGTGVRK